MKKFVYSFNEGSKNMWELLGGKGANLAEMTRIGLPVPFGFTVTTEACSRYFADGGRLSPEIADEILAKMEEVENVTGKKFADAEDPLLVSVRSGSVFSMPGMMDTVLNLGLNDETADGLAARTGNERFAYDSYRRFIQMYGRLVMNIPKTEFDAVFHAQKQRANVRFDVELQAADLRNVVRAYKEIVKRFTGEDLPQDPRTQLIEAVSAVFRSWNNERAVLYRRLNKISDQLGTAVNVQAMVFGNTGDTSCTGVAFTRNPATGEDELFGEFLINAQGEDVVAGIRTPDPISQMEEVFPEVYHEFVRIADVLEKHYKDVQDMEFTVEDGRLHMLQTRPAKRTAVSAVKTAVDMAAEGLISREEAVCRIDAERIDQLLHPKFQEEAEAAAEVLAKGLPASPGAASGRICFSAAEAEKLAKAGIKTILVRQETSPDDLAGMVAAEGILTARGGMTSHAAVVARGMGKCCVAGCGQITIDEDEKKLWINREVFGEDDDLSLNGSKGTVYRGRIDTVAPDVFPDFETILSWSDDLRTLKVRGNADNAEEAAQALQFGAEGIGLCRTEHMFLAEERLPVIRQMIMAETEEERKKALDRLLPYQKADFKELYRIMEDKPVTVRLLDPPLHEFLPQTEEDFREMAEQTGLSESRLRKICEEMEEFNPMLGHRGCRLAVTYPQIVRMQVQALMEAAIEISREKNIEIKPEIMIPLVGMEKEFADVKRTVTEMAEACKADHGAEMEYLVGTMIEVPRAALTAGRLAAEADFFSFGTNDLTQMTFGLSRDDTGDLIKEYVDKGILEEDPFQTIDREGVGVLMETAVQAGRKNRANLKLGICGEHGGDPRSIAFFHRIGLQYVSCSPFRIPIARIAAAQAAIHSRKEE